MVVQGEEREVAIARENARRALSWRGIVSGMRIVGSCCLAIWATCCVSEHVASAAKLELVVPAYFYPSAGSPWTKLTAAAGKVPITAIMNPGNGPGTSQDSNYVSAVNSFRAAGGRVLGYVYSSYGNRAQQTVINDIDNYHALYNVDGIFVDEMANTGPASRLDYYKGIYNHVKSINASWEVMGNPGTTTLEAYLTWPAADKLMVQEDVGSAYASYVPSSWNFNHDRSDFVHLVHTEPSSATMLTDLGLAVQRNAGGIFVTDDVLPNPWDTLPTYWTTLVSAVAAINADYNSDGVVDAADYAVWRNSFGQTGVSLAADGNGDGVVSDADYTIWKNNFGAISVAGSGAAASSTSVPEPASAILLTMAISLLAIFGRAWRRVPEYFADL